MFTVLIVGVNGQDGQYLKLSLLENYDFDVYGLGRQKSELLNCNNDKFKYISFNLAKYSSLVDVLRGVKPNIIFYCAATHGSSGFDYEDNWELVHQVNTLSVHAILKYISENIETHIVYFSSVKVFNNSNYKISEVSEKVNNCLYSLSKNYTEKVIEYYRSSMSIKANIFWLGNHESILRGESYFLSLIIDNLHQSLLNPLHKFKVETLDFYADWGCARQFMDIVLRVAISLEDMDDYIITTGKTVYARNLVKNLFLWKGLDYSNHVIELHKQNDSSVESVISPEKLKKNLGLYPKLYGLELFKSIYNEKYSS